MDHAASVRVIERQRDRLHHARHIERRESARRRETIRQRLAVDMAHDEKGDTADLVGAIDGNDVRVRELGGGARLAQKSVAHSRLPRQIGWQHLDRDFTIEIDVDRQVDDAHAAAAELTENLEIGSQRVGDARQFRLLVGGGLGKIQGSCLLRTDWNLALTNRIGLK